MSHIAGDQQHIFLNILFGLGRLYALLAENNLQCCAHDLGEIEIFLFISFSGVSLNFFRPLYDFFVLNLRKHLGNGSVKCWQYQVGPAR